MIPFPGMFSIGTDLCRMSRIHRIIASPRAKTFIEKMLTPKEITIYSEKLEPALHVGAEALKRHEEDIRSMEMSQRLNKQQAAEIPKPLRPVTEFLAGRWAAKEATIKAHPGFDLRMQDIEIFRKDPDTRNGSGMPYALIHTANSGFWRHASQEAKLSIAHDGDAAVAICLGFRDERLLHQGEELERARAAANERWRATAERVRRRKREAVERAEKEAAERKRARKEEAKLKPVSQSWINATKRVQAKLQYQAKINSEAQGGKEVTNVVAPVEIPADGDPRPRVEKEEAREEVVQTEEKNEKEEKSPSQQPPTTVSPTADQELEFAPSKPHKPSHGPPDSYVDPQRNREVSKNRDYMMQLATAAAQQRKRSMSNQGLEMLADSPLIVSEAPVKGSIAPHVPIVPVVPSDTVSISTYSEPAALEKPVESVLAPEAFSDSEPSFTVESLSNDEVASTSEPPATPEPFPASESSFSAELSTPEFHSDVKSSFTIDPSIPESAPTLDSSSTFEPFIPELSLTPSPSSISSLESAPKPSDIPELPITPITTPPESAATKSPTPELSSPPIISPPTVDSIALSTISMTYISPTPTFVVSPLPKSTGKSDD